MTTQDYLKFMGFTPVEDYKVLSAKLVKPILEIQGHQNHVFAIRDAKGVALFSNNHKIVSVKFLEKHDLLDVTKEDKEVLEITPVVPKIKPITPDEAFDDAEKPNITKRKTDLKGLGFIFKAEELQYVRGGLGIGIAHVEAVNDAEWLTTFSGLKKNIEASNKLGVTPVPSPVPSPVPTPEPETPLEKAIIASSGIPKENIIVASVPKAVETVVLETSPVDIAEDTLSDMCVTRINKLLSLGWIDNGTRLTKDEESLEYKSIEDMSNDVWDKYMLVPIAKKTNDPILTEVIKEIQADVEGPVENKRFMTLDDIVDYYLGMTPKDVNCLSWYDMRTDMIFEFKEFIKNEK